MSQELIIRGARMHNLKNISVTIPKNKLVVITGLSGSGKSSLAFDTIYAEGQRRYVESVSAYARQFLEQMEKPDVDSIEGLSPAISIEQRTSSRNPRSTVGTSTEIYDYLRLLFARVGKPHCYKCGKPIQGQTVSQMVDQIFELPAKTRISILAPIVRGRKGEYSKELQHLMKQGFTRVRIDGSIHELSNVPALNKTKKHDIDLYIDRLLVDPASKSRLADSLETALKHGEGLVRIEVQREKNPEEWFFSEKHACAECSVSFPELSPQLFSFNSPKGACQDCEGLGTRHYFDPELIVPNHGLSLREGAIAPWQSNTSMYNYDLLASLAKHYRFDVNTPYGKLPERLHEILMNGSGAEEMQFNFEESGMRKFKAPFIGVIPQLEKKLRDTSSEEVREQIKLFMNERDCPTCKGTRLCKEAQHVLLAGKNIAHITSLSIRDALPFFKNLNLSKKDQKIAERILKEIRERLGFLFDVGLDYLALDRASYTLSGGEDQRIRLATQIGSALTGVLYVLDEPSIGLHQRDNDRLLNTLKRLRDIGNTVLVVEHDQDTMLEADYIVDLGPGAGVHGGEIVAVGTPAEIMKNSKSLTGQYLANKKKIPLPSKRRTPLPQQLVITGAHEHNLKNIDVHIPLGVFTAVTGVSGSGKSTLINDTLLAGLNQRINRSKDRAGKVHDIKGWKQISKVINIDQSPIGRTPRSNPATYTGVFGDIRELFTELPQAKARGYKAGRFSFNVKGGRCEACEGDGIIRIEMHFLPDVFVECEVCQGKRFNRETLEITYKGASVADVLKMTVSQAYSFFENIPSIAPKLETLIEVGLGYVELGQSATTLSGGEAQRIKLSRELSKRMMGHTLYILDEPTTGLHFHDVERLLEVLQRLVDLGNSLVVIEHNLDVIKCADYCIDMGPDGGDAGGYLVACGTPEELVQHKTSYTGKYLKPLLEAK